MQLQHCKSCNNCGETLWWPFGTLVQYSTLQYKASQLDIAKLCDFKSREVKALLCHHLKLRLWKGQLYLKTSANQEDQNDMRLVLPWAYHTLAMHGCHDDLSHLGTECMLDLLRDQSYWSMMQDDVDQHILDCDRCNRFKVHCEELYPILATYPLELVHIDFLMIENPRNGKDVSVLVITNNFTRYAQPVITILQTAHIMAQALWDEFFTNYWGSC